MTKKKATELGKKLLRRMHGTGWKLQVWENIGWHYCVRNGALTIHVSNTKYFALLSNDNTKWGGGLATWTEKKSYINPNEAVIRQMLTASKHVSKLAKTVLAVNKRIQ